MTAERPILLDVTRLLSRIGRGHPTGIDRVEAAWLGHLLPDSRNRLLCRTRYGQLVLAAADGAIILRALSLAGDGQTEMPGTQQATGWRRTIQTSRLFTEARLARAALARARLDGTGMARALAVAGLAADAAYLNTGHTNVTADLLASLPLWRMVLIHDVIPLDFPQWTRPGQDAVFAARLRAACAEADLLLVASDATALRLADWRGRLGAPDRARIVTAHIGTRLACPDTSQPLPPAPYFLTLGTVEPRKNHALLLDAWAMMDAPPRLIIAGRRGWLNEAVFARLDQMGPDGAIVEMADLSDGAIAALMLGAQALLFPSLAEGFGLPLTEAAARGVPILAQDLQSTRELLGTYVRYLANDPTEWATAVAQLATTTRKRLPAAQVPDWAGHFHKVRGAMAVP